MSNSQRLYHTVTRVIRSQCSALRVTQTRNLAWFIVGVVLAGDGVTQGQMIALSGNTGRSTGPHLDFRIRLNSGAFLDPLSVLP